MSSDTNIEPEERKKWRSIVNYYFSSPALAIFGCLMLKLIWPAIGILIIFGLLLFYSGARHIFHLLPPLTRYLIITAPPVFVLGWIIGEINAGEATIIVLLGIYCILQIISNLSIPPYIENRQSSDS